MRTTAAILALATAICVASARAAPHEADLRAMLGDDYGGAKIVALRGGEAAVVDLETGQAVTLATFAAAEQSDGLSPPRWSPDGRQVILAHEGKAYVLSADGAGQTRVLADEKAVHAPSFWRDGHTGELCIVYVTASGAFRWPDDRGKGQTWLYRTKTGRKQRLADFPCDGGLSLDGRWLADADAGCLLIDLAQGETHVLYGGRPASSASISPDASGRIMHLYSPPQRFGIRDASDTELWRLDSPAGADRWRQPRWSNHPDFCVAVAQRGASTGGRLAVARISDGTLVVLDSLGEGWSAPDLWLLSPAAPLAGPGPIDDLELATLAAYKARLALATDYTPHIRRLRGRDDPEAGLIVERLLERGAERLHAAQRSENALEAEAVYKDLAARYAGLDLGAQARAALASPGFTAELAAAPRINRLAVLAGRLRPVAGAKARFDDAAWFARNRALLVPMVELAAELREKFPGTRAAARAERIAAQYGLPARTEATANERLVVVATIVETSAVPSYESIAPYRDVLTCIRYKVDTVLAGQYDKGEILVWHWGMRDRQLAPAAGWKADLKQKLTLDLFDAHQELEGYMKAGDADDPALTPYWAVSVEAAD